MAEKKTVTLEQMPSVQEVHAAVQLIPQYFVRVSWKGPWLETFWALIYLWWKGWDVYVRSWKPLKFNAQTRMVLNGHYVGRWESWFLAWLDWLHEKTGSVKRII